MVLIVPVPGHAYIALLAREAAYTHTNSACWSLVIVPKTSAFSPRRERTVELLEALPPLLQK